METYDLPSPVRLPSAPRVRVNWFREVESSDPPHPMRHLLENISLLGTEMWICEPQELQHGGIHHRVDKLAEGDMVRSTIVPGAGTIARRTRRQVQQIGERAA